MSKTHKHQATYDYLHDNKEVKGKLLLGVKRYFNRLNFPKWDYSTNIKEKYDAKIQKETDNS